MKVLVLEDEKGVAELYAAALRNAGLEPTICNSFPDARACLKAELPDGLLTDVRVGEFNGLQLVHLFRSMSPTGIVVVATGHDDPTIKAEAEKLGAYFVTKPVDINALVNYFKTPTGQSHR
jgi:two-component system response regulator RegA